MDRFSRRDVLKMASAGMVASAFPRLSLGAPGQARTVVVGAGDNRYECIHDWISPPEGMVFGDTHGLAQDRAGNIYVAHTVNGASKIDDAVCVFDKHGKFLRSFGSRFKGGAHGLDLRREGGAEYLYHCDTQKCVVVKTDLAGNVVWERGTPPEPGVYKDGKRYVPTNVAFGPEGSVYVGDGYGSSYVHQYTVDGDWVRTFGGYGSEPGKIKSPHGLWLDKRFGDPLIAVADRENNRIQYFDLVGKHVRFSTEGMRRPCDFDIRDGMMLVPDLNSVVTLLDEKNHLVCHLGDGNPSNLRGHPRADFVPGRFIHPHDAIFLQNGDILVAEWVPIGRVTLLKKIGR